MFGILVGNCNRIQAFVIALLFASLVIFVEFAEILDAFHRDRREFTFFLYTALLLLTRRNHRATCH